MKIDKNTVEKIAHLARLEVEDVDKSVADMNKILTFMEKLNELDNIIAKAKKRGHNPIQPT